MDIEWKFYPKPQRKCAEVGEEVTFNWGGSGHNVVEVSQRILLNSQCHKSYIGHNGYNVMDDGGITKWILLSLMTLINCR